MNRTLTALVFCLAAIPALSGGGRTAFAAGKTSLGVFLEKGLKDDAAVAEADRKALLAAVKVEFTDRLNDVVEGPKRDAAEIASILLRAGGRDKTAPKRVAKLAQIAYSVIVRGADAMPVFGIVVRGYHKDLPVERIRTLADGYRQMVSGKVPDGVASEALRAALDQGWDAKTFDIVKWDRVKAAGEGFPMREYAGYVFATLPAGRAAPGGTVNAAHYLFKEGGRPDKPVYAGSFDPFSVLKDRESRPESGTAKPGKNP